LTRMAEGVREMKKIKRGLANTLKELREEIEKLEREKASLFDEIEDLKARGTEKVDKLRGEVQTLREDVKMLREIVDTHES